MLLRFARDFAKDTRFFHSTERPMQNRKAALRLCSLYFFSMFAASIFINLAFVNHPNNSKKDASPVFAEFKEIRDEFAEMERIEMEAKAATIEIESKDLTGLKKMVSERRKREQNEQQKAQAKIERSTRQSTENTERARTTFVAAAVAKPKAKNAPNTYVYTEDANDPHPANGNYSKSFVPFDAGIEVYPVKYTAESERYSEHDVRSTIIEKAKKHLGTRYVWAGKKPGGFDCSGFTSYMLSLYGIHVSPSSRHQGVQGVKVNLKDCQAGDLVFFSRYGKGGRISHVAMVVENKGDELYVIHACSRGIVIDNILNDKYWTPKILYARNVISPKAASKGGLAMKNSETPKAAAPAPTTPAPTTPAPTTPAPTTPAPTATPEATKTPE